jgi:hypothetical protein
MPMTLAAITIAYARPKSSAMPATQMKGIMGSTSVQGSSATATMQMTMICVVVSLLDSSVMSAWMGPASALGMSTANTVMTATVTSAHHSTHSVICNSSRGRRGSECWREQRATLGTRARTEGPRPSALTWRQPPGEHTTLQNAFLAAALRARHVEGPGSSAAMSATVGDACCCAGDGAVRASRCCCMGSTWGGATAGATPAALPLSACAAPIVALALCRDAGRGAGLFGTPQGRAAGAEGADARSLLATDAVGVGGLRAGATNQGVAGVALPLIVPARSVRQQWRAAHWWLLPRGTNRQGCGGGAVSCNLSHALLVAGGRV